MGGSNPLPNPPKGGVMSRAWKWNPPAFAHLPLILGGDRKKLSKRFADTAVRDYRREGYLPEALHNFFALMVWHPDPEREVYALDELVTRFRLEELGKSSPIFDVAKLTWLNGLYMRELNQRDPQRVVDLCVESLQGASLLDGEVTPATRAYVASVIQVLGDRLKVGRDILAYGAFFFTDDLGYEPEAAAQFLDGTATGSILSALGERGATVSG